MSTFPSIDAFERELARIERDLDARYRSMGEKVAEAARPEAYRAAAEDLGGDPKFSGWPPWLELQIKLMRRGAALIPTRRSAGPWKTAEDGRNQGNGGGGSFVGPGVNARTGTTRRRNDGSVARVRSRRARRWNGRTAGKGTASKAVARFEKLAEQIPEVELKKLLRRGLDVT